jgi:hypothetical protein
MVKRRQRELKQPTEKPEFNFNPALVKKIAGGAGSVVVLLILIFYVIIPLFESASETVEPEPPPPAKVRVLNGCGVSGLADKLSDFLKANAIEVVGTDNADNFNYPHTIVIEKDTAGHHGRTVAGLMGVINITYFTGTSDSVNVEVIIGKDYNNFKPFKQ